MREYIGSLAKGQILLLAPQPVLLALSIFNILSLFYSAPVIIILAVFWGWFDYSSKSQQRVVAMLKQLDGLIEDFGRLNFQQGSGQDDSRIVGLLDKVNYGSSTTTTPEAASATTQRIKDVYFAFQLWYFSMRHKVRVMLRRAGTLVEYDMIEIANEFIEFYSDYVERIAESALRLVGKGELANPQLSRETFKAFTTRLSELRGRANAFLKNVRDEGYSISGMEVKRWKLTRGLTPFLKVGRSKHGPVSPSVKYESRKS